MHSKRQAALCEARLPDLVLDLFDVYGSAVTRPSGGVIQITMIDENTTYESALAKIQETLKEHGARPVSVVITPGPENQRPFNRKVAVQFRKSDVM